MPSDPPSNTKHPSATLGVFHVRVLAGPGSFARVSQQLTSVIGMPPTQSGDSEVVWVLDNPVQTEHPPRLILNLPKTPEESHFVGSSESGIFEVAFQVPKGGRGRNADTPYGKVVWIPIDAAE